MIAASLLALVTATAVFVRARSRPATVLDELARVDLPRTLLPRLSVQSRYHPCVPVELPGRLIPSAECSGAQVKEDEGLRSLERRIEARADSGDSAAIHADALVELVERTPESGVARAIGHLEAILFGYRPADSLADVAAAYLVRAGKEQRALDVGRAVEAATRALEIDPAHPAALFNRALALEALRHDDDARQTWREYLEVDFTSGWADEAREHLDSLAWKPPPPVDLESTDSALAASAAANPQEALKLGWNVLLGRWGVAVMRGDTATASAALHRAQVLGHALQSGGRDASLADAVTAIREHAGDAAATRRLADAHRRYSAAQEAYTAIAFPRADTLLTDVVQSPAASPPLRGWARAFLAATRKVTNPAEADRLAGEAVMGLDSVRYPALAGRAYWTLGTLRLKEVHSGAGEKATLVAARLLERAGETEHAGAVMINLAEAKQQKTESAEQVLTAWLEAASRLRKYRTSQALHRSFADLSTWLLNDGMLHAARSAADEDLSVARRIGVDLVTVEALDIHANSLARSDSGQAALADVAAAANLLPRLDARARDYFSTVLRATRATVDPLRDPRGAVDALNAAIPQMQQVGVPVRLVTAYLARADAWAAQAEVDSARADVERAYAIIRQGRATRAEGLGRDIGADARSTLDRVVASLVAARRDADALRLLESCLAASASDTADVFRDRMPPGIVAVRYAVVGDSALVWTVSSRGLELSRLPVSAKQLREQVDSAVVALEQRRDEDAFPALRRLYDWLVRPIEPRLAAADTLVLLADGPLSGVPFAALQNSTTGRYLVEEHLFREAAHLSQAAGLPPRHGRGAPSVGLVLNPAFDPELYPRLSRLSGAQAESAAVARWATGPEVVLSDSAARAGEVLRLLGSVSVLHFAGHAIADPEVPDNSVLVLASGPGPGDLGRLSAAEIAGMHFDGLDLVVLSACSTLGRRGGGGGGFTGLGAAFLGAGARGVIGSLWAVNDTRTSQLMEGFYREYREIPNAAAALRNAQLTMLRTSPDAGERLPSAWAGFVYAGR
jgi:CHAT domain-containing protein